MIKKKIFFCSLSLTLLTLFMSCVPKNAEKRLVSGNVSTKEYSVSPFVAIQSLLPFDIQYEQKGDQSVSFEADQDILDQLKVDVKDSVLQLQLSSTYLKDFNPQKAIIHIRCKGLKLVSLNGSGDFLMDKPVKLQKLDFRVEGSGDFIAKNLQCVSFALSVNGSGDATVAGKAEAASYNVNGSGDVNAENYETQNVRVFLNGSGDVTLNTKDYLSVLLNGSGDVFYKTKPKVVDSKVQGSGHVGMK